MKLAVIVPYRNRLEHLNKFVPHLNLFLKKHNIDSSIYIIEQDDNKPFNRGKLLNIGFSLTQDSNDYFCFHDIDMLPIEANYLQVNSPTHIATRVQQFNYSLPYHEYFGGVTLFDKQSFKKINGYSNEFWGWGAEDDDLRNRCANETIQLSRRICTFDSLYHKPNGDTGGGCVSEDTLKNRKRLKLLEKSPNYYKGEGLTSLNFEKTLEKQHEQYTLIKVKL